MATAHDRLTRRAQIAQMLSDGIGPAEMARRLHVSDDTIRRDIAALRALDTPTPTQIASPVVRPNRVPGVGRTVVEPNRRARVVSSSGRSARVSHDGPFGRMTNVIIPPPDYNGTWKTLALSDNVVGKLSSAQLAMAVVDVVPSVSRAFWDFIQMFDPGWSIEVTYPDSKRVFRKADKALRAFIERLTVQHASFATITARMAASAFLRGAICMELVLNKEGTEPVDLAQPDAASITFKKVIDPERGEIFMPGQMQGGTWVALDSPRFRYAPIHPLPGVPYGRPMIAPAMFMALFQLGMYQDLRRVIAQQGYPRMVISIDAEQVRELNGIDNTDTLNEAMDALIDSVQDVWAQLEPDDVYIAPSTITVNRPVGAVDNVSLDGAQAMIEALGREMTLGLKTNPLMMGMEQGISEAVGNRQWEVYVAGIKAIQHLGEHVLEYMFRLALQAQGFQADVKFRFAEIRGSEEMRDATTLQLKLQNAQTAEDLGYMERNEASVYAVGHVAATKERPAQPDAVKPNVDETTSVSGNENL